MVEGARRAPLAAVGGEGERRGPGEGLGGSYRRLSYIFRNGSEPVARTAESCCSGGCIV